MTRPPRLATWLLSCRLPPAERDEVVGDLAEDFGERVDRLGARGASRWYWREALALAWRGTRPPLAPAGRHFAPDEIRYAFRRLTQRPGTTTASIVTLACAIGAGVATWTLLYAVLIYPVPVDQPDRLFVVGSQWIEKSEAPPADRAFADPAIYTVYDAVRRSAAFETVAGSGIWDLPITLDGASENRSVDFVSWNFFATLGLHLQQGRPFTATEDTRGAVPVAIVSDRFWHSVLSGDPNVLGRAVRVNDHLTVIVGVAPAGFGGLDLTKAPDLYMPLHVIGDVAPRGINFFVDPNVRESPTAWISTIGRLRPGASRAGVLAELDGLQVQEPSPRAKEVFGLVDIETAALAAAARPDMARFARLVATTVGLLLVIGCLAVGMQLLMQAEARRDEFAMCLALGASRARMAVGVVCEGAMLALSGAALAVPLGWWLLGGLRALQLPGRVNVDTLEMAPDRWTMAIAIAAAVGATIVLALVAAGFAFSTEVADALRTRAGATPRIGRRRTRAALVVAQIAIALVLLMGAGLFARSLTEVLRLNSGYDTSRLASGNVVVPAPSRAPARAQAYLDNVDARLTDLPGVQSVSMTSPLGAMGTRGRVGMDGEMRSVPSLLSYVGIDDRYFRTTGLSIVRGRDFGPEDRARDSSVGIVSASLGRFLARGGDAIGHRIGGLSVSSRDLLIVGVVPDIVTNVARLEPLVLYVPISPPTGLYPRANFVFRVRNDPAVAIRDVRSVVRSLDPSGVPPIFETIDQQLSKQMGPQRFAATVLGALGVIAALLTFFGVFVLVESMASLRRREMGVRAALGATGGQLGALVLNEALRLVAMGIAAGLVLAWLGAGLVQAFLFRVTPFDARTMAAVIAIIAGLSVVVSLRPARRAATIDPARVLREN